MISEDQAVALLRAANPVPHPESTRSDLDAATHLEDIEQRNATMNKTELESTGTRRRGWTAGLVAAMVVLILVGGLTLWGIVSDGEVPVATDPDLSGPTVEQMTAVRRLVDAINARDLEGFIDIFSPGAAFDPRGDFQRSVSLFGNDLPVAEEPAVEAWLSIIEAWGLEADPRGCLLVDSEEGWQGNVGLPRMGVGNSVIVCEVAAGWSTLSMELIEEWAFEFNEEELLWWAYKPTELNPARRSLSLGYEGLEEWEAWLERNDPQSAARYLNPRPGPPADCDGCDEWVASLAPDDPELAARLAHLLWSAENDWVINGYRFWPDGLIPYDPAFTDEIEASIREYLASK